VHILTATSLDGDDRCNAQNSKINGVPQGEFQVGLPQRLRDVDVPEAGLKECSKLALSDAVIVYNPKFISESSEVLKVYQEGW
jgi:alcohol dehydrogenase class IV